MKNKKKIIKKMDIVTILDFINIFMIVSYNYLRMLGMNDKRILFIYVVVTLILALLKIIKLEFEKKELKKIYFFIGLMVFSCIVVDEVDFLLISIMAIAFLKDDSKKIVKYFLISSVIWYISIILLYILGIQKNNELIRLNNDNKIIYRNSLGFSHVNQVFLYFLPIQLCFYLLYSDRKLLVNSIALIISTILFLFSNCRTGYLCTIIFIVIYNVPIIVNNKFVNIIAKWVFLIFTLLSIIIAIKYGSNGANNINDILSLRPYYLKRYIDENNIINISGGNFKKNLPLDNLYIYLLIEKGIIIYFVYFWITAISMEIFKDSAKFKIVVFIFLIYGLFEAYIVLPSINFIMIIQIKNIILENKEKNFLGEIKNE